MLGPRWICLGQGTAVALHSFCSSPPLFLLQAVLPSNKFLISSGSFYIWNLCGSPGAAAVTREGPYYAGHRHKSEWVRNRGWLSSGFLALYLLPTPTPTCFFNGAPDPPPDRREKCVQGIHWLSKAYFISLLTRLQGCGWHGAKVAEAFKHTAGRPSSIKTNQWSIQSSSRPCCDEKGGRKERERGRERERDRENIYLYVDICHL